MSSKKFPYKTVKPSTLMAMEEDNRNYSVSLSPAERLAFLHQLIINAYGIHVLEIKDFGKTIYRKL